MTDLHEPIFIDLDAATGQPRPTTYESMRTAIVTRHHLEAYIPEDAQALLLAAVDYIALAYEQANVGRIHLYEQLTNDAFLKMTLALERSLKVRLGRGNRVRLEALIEQGIAEDLLPDVGHYEAIWTELRKNRNAIAHGDPERDSYGPLTAQWIGLVIDAINLMFAIKTDVTGVQADRGTVQ
ncbi:MAG: hypothetical protein QM589_17225 [Thermomicrobiales bacterium]